MSAPASWALGARWARLLPVALAVWLAAPRSAHADPPVGDPPPAGEKKPGEPPEPEPKHTPALAGDGDTPRKTPWIDVGGFLRPGFGLRVRPQALPRDELEYGFFGQSGLIVESKPFSMWRARLEVIFSTSALDAVTDVELFDLNGDTTPDGLVFSTEAVPGVLLQEATVSFEPHEVFAVVAGALYIPFSLQQQSPNTALMFPARSPPNEVFLSGADLGALAQLNLGDGIFVTSLGAFNGNSLGLTFPNAVARGVVFSYRADVNPFGEFAQGEGDSERGPFRLGVGFGAMYRPARLFDERTGTEATTLHDLRLSASLRMAFRGLYVGAEYFRRQQVDDFTSRPQIADGAYALASFFFPVAKLFGLEPIARVGFVAQDQGFDPRLTGWTDAGFNLYPLIDIARPDRVRVTLQYLGERRFTEQETAHGFASAVQLNF